MTDSISPAAGRLLDAAARRATSRPAANGRPFHDGADKTDDGLQTACSELESLFLNHLLQKMRATIEKSDLLDGGQSEAMYTSMLDGEIARNLANSGGIGLARVLYQQLAMSKITTPGEAEKQAAIGLAQQKKHAPDAL